MQQEQIDTYQWRVIYQDSTATDECGFDANGRNYLRAWSELEQKPIQEVLLMTWSAFDDRHYRVAIPDGAEPVFFRRRTVAINPTDATPQETVHCIGWKREGSAVYLFVFADGSTLLTDDLQAV